MDTTGDIKTIHDKLMVFKCGHAILNPKKLHNRSTNSYGYRCPICSGVQPVAKSYVQCQRAGCEVVIERPYSGSKVQYCDPCRKIMKREHRLKRKKTAKSNTFYNQEHIHATYGDIANELGVSKERARQITTEAVRKFRKNWREEIGTEPVLGDERPDETEWGNQNRWAYRGM